jgi:A/G-specific adenine glycosylase
MLQRTKADQVVPVYEEFLRRYPSFDHIAKASDREIVSLFSRLGLRWRARNVVKLIRALRRQHNGVVPRDPDQLRDLPAVGEYVARAVLCYAFGERIPPIDANVVRVISRLFGLSGKADVARRSRQISEITGSLIPEEMSRDFNLSLLDFGALVCRPKPLCHMCPLSRHCSYYGKSQANEKMKF